MFTVCVCWGVLGAAHTGLLGHEAHLGHSPGPTPRCCHPCRGRFVLEAPLISFSLLLLWNPGISEAPGSTFDSRNQTSDAVKYRSLEIPWRSLSDFLPAPCPPFCLLPRQPLGWWGKLSCSCRGALWRLCELGYDCAQRKNTTLVISWVTFNDRSFRKCIIIVCFALKKVISKLLGRTCSACSK